MSKEQDFTEKKMLIVQKALSKLYEEERQTIVELINRELCAGRMEFLRNFMINFDPDSPIDTCVCQVMTQVGQQIGAAVIADIEKGKQEGNLKYSGLKLLNISIKEIQKVAEEMKKSLEKLENEH